MKKILYFFTAFVLGSAPFLARAQWDPRNYDQTDLPSAPIGDIIANLLDWLLAIIGGVAIIAFLISAIQYFLAGADEEMAKKAKSSMLYAIIGVIVALVGLVILRAADAFLNAEPF